MRRFLAPSVILALVFGCKGPDLADAREVIEINPAELSFGNVIVGERQVKRVLVRNASRSGDMTLDFDEAPSGYAVVPSVVSLRRDEGAVVEIGFAPLELGLAEGAITFGSRLSRTKYAIHVKGTGIVPKLRVEGSLDFGDVGVGERERLPLTFASETDEALEISIANPQERIFQIQPASFTIAPRAETTVHVDFHPANRGPVSTSLRAECAGCESIAIGLRGNGVIRELRADPRAIDFGKVPLTRKRVRTVNLVNSGDREITFGQAVVEGGGFVVENDRLPSGLPAGASVEVDVSFGPLGQNKHTGALRIVDSAGEPLVAVPLVGDVGGAVLRAVPELLDYGTVVVGNEPSLLAITLENVGEEDDYAVVSALIDGPDAAAFNTAAIRTEDGSSTIGVEFVPPSERDYSANLVLRTTLDTQPEIHVALSGTGLESRTCRLRVLMGRPVVGEAAGAIIHLDNVGEDLCVLWNFRMLGEEAHYFQMISPPPEPVQLPPGETLKVTMVLRPEAPSGRTYGFYFAFDPPYDLPGNGYVACWK